MRLVYLTLMLLASCATKAFPEIDYNTPPPADYPKLMERIVIGTKEEVHRRCSAVKEEGVHIACALAYYPINLCIIHTTSMDAEILKHERAHCAGYSHVGDGPKAKHAWEKWKANNR